MKSISAFLICLIFNTFYFGQVNAYARVTAISGTTLTVNNVNQTFHTFVVGQLAVVMQMQDNVIGTNTNNNVNFGDISSIGSAGLFEIRRIVSINGNSTVNFSTGSPTSIVLDGVNNTYSTTVNSSLQLITFRQLSTNNFTTTANIIALPWNGLVGGVIAIDVPGTLTLNHNISADGAGFRGGAVSNDFTGGNCQNLPFRVNNANYGFKGEGIYRITNTLFLNGRAKVANGGGGGGDHNGGGGGGSNFTEGGNGGSGWNGGSNCTGNVGFGYAGVSLSTFVSPSRMFMGGAGGGGQGNNGVSTAGGNGGGIILIRANTLTTAGSCAQRFISANGNTANNGGNDGMGGGGAAGSINLFVTNYNIVSSCDLFVNANGGNGGSVNNATHGGGGAGGQGVVQFNGPQPTNNITTTTNNGNPGCNNNSNPCNNFAGSASGTNNSGIINGSGTPLPITLTYFKAKVIENDDVELIWETSSEQNSHFFTVERSMNGKDWTFLDEVNAAGNSTQLINYNWIDGRPLNGLSYYRLKQTDLDGTEKNHGIRSILREGEEIQLFPNPAQNQITIQGDFDKSASLQLFDVCGKDVFLSISTLQENEQEFVFDITQLSNGLYLLRVDNQIFRFVKK